MKIALVSEHASPLAALGGVDAGGQNVHVAELAAALARSDHDVTVYTRRDSRHIPDEVRVDAGYRVVHVPAGPPETIPKDDLLPYMPRFGDFLTEAWTAERPDVAHAHFWMSGIATHAAAKALHLPFVMTFHALGEVKRRYQGAADTSPHSRIDTERELATAADRVVATCSDEAFELTRMGVDRSRISVVPCGVDLDMFSPDGETAPKPEKQAFRVVTVGRMVPRKGFGTVIEALPHMPDVELVLVGGPDATEFDTDTEVRRLKAFADSLGVGDRTRMIGQVARPDMPSLLRSADVVVCAPWYEPFGIVPLEAMACGVPVVASAVGGLLDTVVDGRTGSLVPPKDPESTANAVRRILADVELRADYSRNALERAPRYSWNRIAKDTARAYGRAVQPSKNQEEISKSR